MENRKTKNEKHQEELQLTKEQDKKLLKAMQKRSTWALVALIIGGYIVFGGICLIFRGIQSLAFVSILYWSIMALVLVISLIVFIPLLKKNKKNGK